MSSQHADEHHEIALASGETPAAPTEPATPALVVSTWHDERSTPLDTAFSDTPKIKMFLLGGPVADGHAMVESVLARRTGFVQSFASPYKPRTTRKILFGLTSGNMRDAVVDAVANLSAYVCLGPIGFLVLPGIWAVNRVREARRVRQGGHDRHERLGSLPVPSKKLPWELRSPWLLAAWKLFSLMRCFNLRAQAVNEALGDATMSVSEHAAALGMGELLCKTYPQIEYVRRFLEEDTLRGAELSPKGLEACSHAVNAVNVFGRGAPLDWLLLPPPAHNLTRAQVLAQWLADQEGLSSTGDPDQDEIALKIKLLEEGQK